jgi:hypothetical protein
MKSKEKIYKQIFAIRKGGENGEKRFITLGNVMMSSKLHDSEEEAVKELENLTLESVSKMLIAVINACDEMIKNKLNNEEK